MAKSACASSVVSSKWSTAHRLSSCLLYLDPKHVCAATRQSVQARCLNRKCTASSQHEELWGPQQTAQHAVLAALRVACDLRAL